LYDDGPQYHPQPQQQQQIEQLPELAGSPHRSIYTWRDTSSPAYPRYSTGSHPTSPTPVVVGGSQNQIDYYPSYAQHVANMNAMNHHRMTPTFRTATLPGSPNMRRHMGSAGQFSSDNSPSHRVPSNTGGSAGMTFSRALQMSDSLELSAARVADPNNCDKNVQQQQPIQQQPPNTQESSSNRRSVYEMNYEISV
jgi:hypothetical protein